MRLVKSTTSQQQWAKPSQEILIRLIKQLTWDTLVKIIPWPRYAEAKKENLGQNYSFCKHQASWFAVILMLSVQTNLLMAMRLLCSKECILYLIWSPQKLNGSKKTRTPQVRSRNYWVSAIKKPNQMANRTLNFEAGNGNWWRPCNHERKLLIGPEHTFHWLHWRTSCLLVGKYGWKGCGKLCNLVWIFDNGLWRELGGSLANEVNQPTCDFGTSLRMFNFTFWAKYTQLWTPRAQNTTRSDSAFKRVTIWRNLWRISLIITPLNECFHIQESVFLAWAP